MIYDRLKQCTGFDWDSGNDTKNQQKHSVLKLESEEAFFNMPFIVSLDTKHSLQESRFFALGKTDIGRKLFIVFTLRGNLIRIISARDMNKKERSIYEQKNSTI